MRERLVAHRGNAAEFPENSLTAIYSAIDLGLSYVEFDVQMSADVVPCLIHDGNLSRLYGANVATVDLSFDELRSLGIASLAQAMMVLKPHEVTAFVEIKGDSLQRFGAERIVESVCSVLMPCCVVISFDEAILRLARVRGYRVGLIIRGMTDASRSLCEALAPDYIFCEQSQITRKVWEGPVWVSYEVSDQRTASRLIGHGVELLETMSVRKMSTLQ